MRFTLLATLVALAAADSFSSFSDPSSSSSSSSFSSSASSSASSASFCFSASASASSTSTSASTSSSPPDVEDFKSHYLAYYAPYQMARLATFRASRAGNDSLTEEQDALLFRAESAVAAGNASEIAAVKDLCISTFGIAGCAALAGVESGTCDGGTEQLLQKQRIHSRDQMAKRPICTCTGLREIIVSEKCFCHYRRRNCVFTVGGCGFMQGGACVGRCAPGT
ncbi:hypothetical protein BBO_04862 [Beauveria brongniartii RCEF 3172]|uniref:Uncharacterized protein n=1 Tax=Beauveria brongniartii RCEF 3172 TaxID=1081107 RepID=A0A167DVS1_9HYPO|nr:hypothetical protein BBO_04862 [Beauveria brongniartii RCEF 3172]